jgi:hypothetical protein
MKGIQTKQVSFLSSAGYQCQMAPQQPSKPVSFICRASEKSYRRSFFEKPENVQLYDYSQNLESDENTVQHLNDPKAGLLEKFYKSKLY